METNDYSIKIMPRTDQMSQTSNDLTLKPNPNIKRVKFHLNWIIRAISFSLYQQHRTAPFRDFVQIRNFRSTEEFISKHKSGDIDTSGFVRFETDENINSEFYTFYLLIT